MSEADNTIVGTSKGNTLIWDSYKGITEADSVLATAKTEMLQLRIAEKCRALILRSEVDETLDAIAGIVTISAIN